MPRYLLVESRDPFESRSFGTQCELATALLRDAEEVTLMLVENGVFASRSAASVRELERAAQAGVAVIADEFALRERGIPVESLADYVKPVRLDVLAARIAAGARILWN